MDRRYIIGFCIGILLTLGGLWINSLIEDFQKQEQSKNTVEQQVMSLMQEREMRRADIYQMRAELNALKDRLSSYDNVKLEIGDMKFRQGEFEKIFFDFKSSLGR